MNVKCKNIKDGIMEKMQKCKQRGKMQKLQQQNLRNPKKKQAKHFKKQAGSCIGCEAFLEVKIGQLRSR